jgi:hypothetical protein
VEKIPIAVAMALNQGKHLLLKVWGIWKISNAPLSSVSQVKQQTHLFGALEQQEEL